MSELPKGWAEVELRDVVQPMENYDPAKTGDLPFRYVDIGSINNKTFSIENPKILLGREAPSRAKRKIRRGDVLFSTVRTYLKNIAMVPEELDGEITSTGIAVLRPSNAVLSGFLFALVRSEGFIRPLSLKQDGTLYPAITDGDLLGHRIALPPMAEQERIVAKLDALNAKSTRARTELARIETLVSRYNKAVLNKAFSGDGLGIDVPNVRRLSEVVSLRTGPFGSALHKSDYIEGGVPLINPMHIVKGKIAVDPMTSVTVEKAEELEEFRLRVGDVVLARRGEMGRAAVVGDSEDGYLCGTGSMIVRPGRTLIPIYLQLYLSSPGVVSALENAAVGTTMVNLNQSILLDQSIPLPSPEEQHEIVRRIESAFAKIDRLAKEAERALELVGRLDEAILAKAFRGELVPQDENDEPASLLLQRIRQADLNRPAAIKRTGPKRQGKNPDMARTIVEALSETRDWLSAQELFERCGVRDGSSTENVEVLYRQLLQLERDERIEIEEVADPTSGVKLGDRVRLRR